MKDITILIKYGEISLKKGNRRKFENKLIDNIRDKFKDIDIEIKRTWGRFYITAPETYRENLFKGLQQVFGIVGFTETLKVSKNLKSIKEKSLELARREIKRISTNRDSKVSFKAEVRRLDKSFKYNSYEIACEIGDFLLSEIPELKVDVHKPHFIINVEIRDLAYIYSSVSNGLGGLPVGSSGKGILLLSGGIDSPVAGYLMAKRGLAQEAVYYHSPPYTSEMALDKVKQLTGILSDYIPNFKLNIVYFTKIQERIKELAKPEDVTLMMRGAMVEIADMIAQNKKAVALITGESLGQVASQTPESLRFSGSRTSLPVLRPLIGYDKEEIIKIARKIGTFETSILPYDDCCTLFAPQHPTVKPNFEETTEEYNSLGLGKLNKKSLNLIETF